MTKWNSSDCVCILVIIIITVVLLTNSPLKSSSERGYAPTHDLCHQTRNSHIYSLAARQQPAERKIKKILVTAHVPKDPHLRDVVSVLSCVAGSGDSSSLSELSSFLLACDCFCFLLPLGAFPWLGLVRRFLQYNRQYKNQHITSVTTFEILNRSLTKWQNVHCSFVLNTVYRLTVLS